jgi:replicative DNA helicase
VVIDHLQLLDQRRKAPELQQQVLDLRSWAKRMSCTLVFISQLRSALDPARWPSMSDIRLLDDLDLRLFDKFLFLREGRVQLFPGSMRPSAPAGRKLASPLTVRLAESERDP